MADEGVERGATSKRFVRVASRDDVPPGMVKSVDVDGESIALCNFDGTFYAVHDECTHECFPLSEGTLEGEVLECMLHGAQFDVRTGEVLSPPAYEAVKTYEVRLEGENILIAADDE